MEPIWRMNGIMAHGTSPAKQRWKCYQCKEQCTTTTGLNEEPMEDLCHEASATKVQTV